MFSRQRISLFIIVLGVLIAIGTGLNAHFVHDVSNKDLSFSSSPTISCNIDGYTFTHTRETYSDGVVYTDGWWRRPLAPKVEIEASTHGFGWATILFYGNIDGQAEGDAVNASSPDQLGSWNALLPFAYGIDNTVGTYFGGSFNSSPKTYSWDASGSIKLVPAYWQWSFPSGGEWLEASDMWSTTGTASTGGSWTVNKNWTTLTRSSPGSRSSSSSSSSSGCANLSGPNYCNDQGSCSTRSGSGVPGECGHNFCCCAPSGSPTYNGGSSSGSGSGSGSSSSSSGSSSSSSSSPSSSTVACGNSCGASVSSRYEHRETCYGSRHRSGGQRYWTCNDAQNNECRDKTCRFCGTTFKECERDYTCLGLGRAHRE